MKNKVLFIFILLSIFKGLGSNSEFAILQVNTIGSNQIEQAKKYHIEAKELLSQDKINKAIPLLFQALEIFKHHKKSDQIGEVYISIGKANTAIRKFDECLKNNQYALLIFKQLNDSFNLALAYSNIANCYLELNKDDSALINLKQCQKFLLQKKTDKLQYLYLIRLSIYYYKKNDLNSAINYLRASIKFADIGENIENDWIVYNNLGYIYLKMNRLDSSKINLQRALTKAQIRNNTKGICTVNQSLYEYYLSKRDFESAFNSYHKYVQLNEILRSAEIKNNFKLEEMKYQFKIKEQELKFSKIKEDNLHTEQFARQKYFYTTIIFLIVLILVILIFILVYRSIRAKAKINEIAAISEKEKHKIILQIQESEKEVIAKEIHDTLGAQIVSIKFIISGCIQQSENQELNLKLSNAAKQTDFLADQVRNISHRMLPITLSEYGIITAIEELLSMLLSSAKISHTFEHRIFSLKPFPEIELGLYRIMEELLVNIIKHANCTHVNVTLYNYDMEIVLMVEDNGKGMSKVAKAGLGLVNMQSRIKAINGVVSFESNEDMGTVSVVRIRV